jgi:hypothetical protein
VPQINHRVGESFERVVDLTQVLEAKQQAAELVLPGKDTFDGPKALLEDSRIKALLAAPLRGFTPARIFSEYWAPCPG